MKFRHLDVPRQWTETFTKYPHGLTIFEALVSWTSQVDSMVDNVNDWNNYLDDFVDNFEFELQEEVQSTITKWQNEGLLDVIIESALDTELDTVKSDMAEIETELDTVKSDMAETETEINNIYSLFDGIAVEGAWTPYIYSASRDYRVAGYSSQEGKYIRIGNLVNCFFRLTINDLGSDLTDNPTVSLRITLPFTVKSGDNLYSNKVGYFNNINMGEEQVDIGMNCRNGENNLGLYRMMSDGTTVTFKSNNLTDTADIIGSITYMTEGFEDFM